MTDQAPSYLPPTIALIGGPMTVDDGTQLDSRQRIEGDPGSSIARKALAGSPLWWATVSSLVLALLDSAGPDAFALLVGPRTIAELRSDGSTKRTSLRKYLRGGVGRVSVVWVRSGDQLPDGYRKLETPAHDDPSRGFVGIRDDASGDRWRLLDGGDYGGEIAKNIKASVIVDTSGAFMSDDGTTLSAVVDMGGNFIDDESFIFDTWMSDIFDYFERSRLGDGVVAVLPHTHASTTFVNRYLAWLQQGRQSTPHEYVWPPPPWDPKAPPNPIRYTHPIPVKADFGVTGLVQNGRWVDPSALEAARSLLEARYDLKLGIWDLVENPTLRRTILETLPTTEAPAAPAMVPAAAAQRAEQAVARQLHRDAEEASALRKVAHGLRPLKAAGWSSLKKGHAQCPLTEPVSRWKSDDPWPLVWLALQVTKRATKVYVGTIMGDDVDLPSYVEQHRAELERIVGEPLDDTTELSSQLLLEAPGGWADDVEWETRASELAHKTAAWAAEFTDLADECRKIHYERKLAIETVERSSGRMRDHEADREPPDDTTAR